MHKRELPSLLRLAPLAAALACCFAAVAAHADEKNPAVEACAGKTEGAPCSTQRPHQDASGAATMKSEPGTCQPDECCTLDYSQGSPPKSTCAACLACKPGPATPAAEGGAGEGGGGEPPRHEDGGPPAHEPAKKGCAIGGESSGALGLGVFFCVAFLGRRR